jgi:CubicO group peptidase (beta-lactamase class C family)
MSAAQAPAPPPAEQPAAIFEDLDGSTPGAAYAVVEDGEITHSGACGLASLEHEVANSLDTVFYIASTSKQFVAACILMLEAEGKVDLAADFRTYLPELSGWSETIRVHHLLHHTSGIRDKYALGALGELPEETYTTDGPTLDLLARQRTLNFAPGSRFMYSNSGYFLLARIVERTSGKGLREFAAERIFEPLGMTSTRFRPDAGEVIPRKASGYLRRQDGWRLAEYSWPSIGPGGVFTTIGDMVLWDRALNGRHHLQPGDLHDRMLVTRQLAGGAPNGYAAGLSHGTHRGAKTVGHDGGVTGYSAGYVRFPDLRASVICFANSSSIGASTRALRLAGAVLADRLDPAPAVAAATGAGLDAAYLGVYLSDDGSSLLRVENPDSGPVVVASGAALPLQAVARNRARLSMGLEIEFSSDGMALLGEPGRAYRRLEPQTGADLEPLAGTYVSDELGQTLEVRLDGTGLVIVRDGRRLPLRQVAADLFTVRLGRFGQEFEVPARFADGALSLSMDRALDVRFLRRRSEARTASAAAPSLRATGRRV